VLVVPSRTLGLVFGGAFLWSGGVAVPDKGSEAELNLLLQGPLPVLDETPLLESFLAFFLLLRLEIRGVGDMTLLAVTVLTVDLVIKFGLLYHDNLVNASFTGGCD